VIESSEVGNPYKLEKRRKKSRGRFARFTSECVHEEPGIYQGGALSDARKQRQERQRTRRMCVGPGSE